MSKLISKIVVPDSSEATGYALYNVKDANAIPASEKGVASGVATLDSSGKVPSSQLPSYVDDVIEGYYHDNKFYATYTPGLEEQEGTYSDEITPELGKIYIDIPANQSYRWSGSTYIVISSPYVLPTASANTLGGVKVGDGLSIDNNGVLSTTSLSMIDGVIGVNGEISRYCICNTATDVAAKIATLESGEIDLNSKVIITVNFIYPNAEEHPTLNINNTGNKDIYVKGNVISGTAISLLYGVCNFVYNGTGWELIGGGITSLDETLIIHLQTNNSIYNSDLVGASIVVRDTVEDTVLYNDEWDGNDILLAINAATNYTITVGNVVGYKTPDALNYVAKSGNLRIITNELQYETTAVTVSAITNQSSHDDLDNINITVDGDRTVVNNGIVKVSKGDSHTITFPAVTGYSTPAAITFTPTADADIKTATYNTELVIVTINTNVSGVSAQGQVVTINGVNTIVPASGVVSQKVAYGTSYSVSVNGKSGYNKPSNLSYTANSVSRTATMTYTKIVDGVYAVTTTGDLVQYADINTSSPSSYVGVAINDTSKNMSFFIDKRFPTGSAAAANVGNFKAWSAALYNKDQSYLTNISTSTGDGQSISTAAPAETRTAAFNAYNNGETGVANTTNLVNDSNASSENASNNAAKYCRSIANPVTGSYDGYLASLAEWIVVNDNQVAVNQILNAIGGVAFASTNSGYKTSGNTYTYYRTSSEYSSRVAWDWGWRSSISFAYFYGNGKDGAGQYYCARPFFPLA